MLYPKTADWSDCGTGKSLVALAKFNALYEAKIVKRLLIVCPLSVMTSWKQEIKSHTNFRITLLTGTKEQKLDSIRSDDQIFLITYDSVAGRKGYRYMYLELLKKFSGNNMIVCDEASMIKSIVANRTKALIGLCDAVHFSMFLSGTFMPQNIQDVFTIYRVMDGGETFGDNIYKARSVYMENVGGMFPRWVVREDMREVLIKKLYQRAIRIRKEDCTNLPEKVFEKRYSYLSAEQNKHYDELRLELSTELDNTRISATNILSKMTKMQQIVGGFLYDKKGKSHAITGNKYDALLEVLEQVNPEEKVIVYARFREELANIANLLALHGYQNRMLHGGMSINEREQNIREFRTHMNVRVLVAQVATGGYGLTVIEANHIVYFSMTFGLTDYLQSQDRIHRIGQTKTCIYHFLLTADPGKRIIDEYIYDKVMAGKDITMALSDPAERQKLKEELT